MSGAQFPRFATAAAAVTLVVAVASAGCFATDDQCQQDYDCGSGDVCANTRECVAASDVQRVAVRWTVRGNPASSTTCAGITSLEITVIDDGSGVTRGYAPVPCATGIFTFDKLPREFDRLTLGVNGEGGATESFNAAISAGQDIQFDLGLGSVPVDAGVP